MDQVDLNRLAWLRVKERTLTEYDAALNKFLNWCPDTHVMPSIRQMDKLLNTYAHHIYDSRDGQGLGHVDKVKAGIEFYIPMYYDKLVNSERSLQGWRKVVVKTPHRVCPEGLAYVIARRLLRKGECNSAVAVLLQFDTYMRAADLNGLYARHVHILEPATGPRDYHALVYIPKGKTDERITLYVRPHWLAVLLKQWKERRVAADGENARMLGVSIGKYRTHINNVMEEFGLLDKMRITPHTFRYGGATADMVLGRRTFAEIKANGRWTRQETAQAYIQVSGLMEQLGRLPQAMKERMEKYVASPYKTFGVTAQQE